MDFGDWPLEYEAQRLKAKLAAKQLKALPPAADATEKSRRAAVLRRSENFPDSAAAYYQTLQGFILQQIHDKNKADRSDDCRKECVAYNQASIELDWCRGNKPYYKLFPDMLDMLLASGIDVPSSFVHTPLPTICLRLPTDHGIEALRAPNGEPLRAVLVMESASGNKARISDVVSEASQNRRQLLMWSHFGEHSEYPTGSGEVYPVVAFQVVDILDEDAKFEDNMQESMKMGRYDWDKDAFVPPETMLNVLRLTVGACLLATNAADLIEADVLNKHVARYRTADDKERQRLHEVAKRRGKYGWRMGREISLPSRCVAGEANDGSTPRALSHSHLRRGHFHIVRYGEGKRKLRVAWFRPTIVRSDLPAKGDRRGYVAGQENEQP